MEISKEDLLKNISEIVQENMEKVRKVLSEELTNQTKTTDYQKPEEKSSQEKITFAQHLKSIYDNTVSKALYTSNTGGYAVPEVLADEIFSAISVKSIFLQKADITYQPTYILPVWNSTYMDFTNGLYGGFIAYNVDEGTAPTESSISFEKLRLECKNKGLLAYVSKKQLASTPIDLANELQGRMVNTMAAWLDYDCLNGTGTTSPMGILQSGATGTVSRGTAGKVALADVASMYAKLAIANENNLIWIIHSTARGEIAQLNSSGYLTFMPSLREGLPDTLFGIPIHWTIANAKLGSTGDVILADMSFYKVIMDRNISVALSEHYKFAEDNVAFKCIFGRDGAPKINNGITIAASTLLYPFVALT